MRPPPWTEPDSLLELVEELRQAGFNIGAGQFIATQELVLALVARGERMDQPERLEGLLGPVLCCSPREQQSFPQYYRRWLELIASPPAGAHGTVGRKAEPAPELEDELYRLERGASWWRWGLAALAALLTVLFLLRLLLGGV